MNLEQDAIVRIRSLNKTFTGRAGKVTALDGIDLDIRRGEIFGIIGLSGAGKSTLVRCINFLEKPTAGTVTVDGQELGSLSKKQLLEARRSMGMIFQQFNLLQQRTALQNICFPLEIAGTSKADAEKRAKELLEIVGLSDRAGNYPSQLSGGQQQRVAIARALATNPKILLCDEATSALDPTTTRSILALLKEINKTLGITIIVITHEMAVIEEICQRVAIIDSSRIAEVGAVDDVFTRPQSAMAKQLIYPDGKRRALATGKRYCRIVFDGNSSFEPIVSNMVLECKAPVNIMFADTKNIDGKAYGQMILQLPEDERAAKRALAYLETQKTQMLPFNVWAQSLWETLYMVILSTAISYLIGLPLGLTLVVTDKNGIRPMPVLNTVLGIVTNILRSIPFLILAVMITPITRAIVGKAIGTTAMVVPLTFAAAPYVARMVESSIKEVPFGVIEAAQSMGASPWQIVWKVLVPEAKPSLMVGGAISIVTILGYSAMAGFIGGGGLGTVAVNYGYNRYNFPIMLIAVIIIVVVVQIFQEVGMRLAHHLDKRNR